MSLISKKTFLLRGEICLLMLTIWWLWLQSLTQIILFYLMIFQITNFIHYIHCILSSIIFCYRDALSRNRKSTDFFVNWMKSHHFFPTTFLYFEVGKELVVVIPGSVLRDHPWWCSGGNIWSAGHWNQGWLHAGKTP